MKLKAILSAALAASLVLCCLTGCGKDKQAAPSAEPASDSTADTMQTPLALKDTEVLGEVTAIEGLEVTFRIFGGRPAGMPGENGQQPPEMSGGDNAQQPPEMPGGDHTQQPPEMPGGEGGQPQPDGQTDAASEAGNPGGGPHEHKNGRQEQAVTLTLDEDRAAGLTVGDLVRMTFDTEGRLSQLEALDRDQMGGFHGGPDGRPVGRPGDDPGSGSADSGTAANTAETDLSGGAFTSMAADENALRVSGSTVTLTDLTLTKTGDGSNTETCDFYGMNAGLLAMDGATVTVRGGSYTTHGAGANALFCYGSGTTLTVKDAVIRTASRNSGGIQTAGGGTTVAENLTVETEGPSAAAIRSDRGGGTVRVTGGSYVTHGTGSPAVYSTAEISVTDARLTATASEAIVVEGKNSVSLTDCAVSGSMAGTYGGNSEENLHGVMVYQSMSGDAGVGKGCFTMTGGSLSTTEGDLFYVTNTKAELSLTGVELHPANGILLRAAGNDGSRGWGAAGSNGGSVTMTVSSQQMSGNILVDEISSLKLSLRDGSLWEGTVNPDGDAGQVQLTLEGGSRWILTGDAWLSSFSGDLGSVEANGFHLYVNGSPVV